MMIDREKTRAEIEARLTQLGETINTLRRKAEQQEETFERPLNQPLDTVDHKRLEVRQSLPQMETLDAAAFSSTVAKVRNRLEDIDGSLRQARAHLKQGVDPRRTATLAPTWRFRRPGHFIAGRPLARPMMVPVAYRLASCATVIAEPMVIR